MRTGGCPQQIPRRRLRVSHLAAAIRTAVHVTEMGDRAERLGIRFALEAALGGPWRSRSIAGALPAQHIPEASPASGRNQIPLSLHFPQCSGGQTASLSRRATSLNTPRPHPILHSFSQSCSLRGDGTGPRAGLFGVDPAGDPVHAHGPAAGFRPQLPKPKRDQQQAEVLDDHARGVIRRAAAEPPAG